ncbi:hypothetical protein ACFV6B_30495 [Streptomyces microflavus]|uniref:hypothetical protein n=1 Tax=Streptomyces microflavus TaxID=1919 RepID=UPI00364C36B5
MDDSLSFESFFEGAKKAAFRAMDDHGRGEYDEFALHAGVAIERLAKAALVRRNPAYLIEFRNGNPDMLLYLCGDLEMEIDQVRTVGAKDAIKRLRRLSVLGPDSQLDLLIEIRNGAAHTSTGDKAKSHLPTLAVHIGALLQDLGLSELAFWGRWTSAVGVAVDKKRSEIQRDVEIRIKQARHLFEDRFVGLPDGIKETILAKPSDGPMLGPMTMKNGNETLFVLTVAPCPACTANASLSLTPLGKSRGGGVNLVPDGLQCHLCGLELHSAEEINASGVDTKVSEMPMPTLFNFGRPLPFDVQWGETHTG